MNEKNKRDLGPKIKELLLEGKNIKSVMNELNCSYGRVHHHAKITGLFKPHIHYKRFDWEEIKSFYESGNTYTECKEKFKFSAANWCTAIKKGIITPRERTSIFNEWLHGNGAGVGKNSILGRDIREYLKDKANNKCSLCGWGEINPTLNRSPLEVDHIDGNWKNNKPDNLRVLCPNCHALQPTYKALNKGNGRTYRKN